MTKMRSFSLKYALAVGIVEFFAWKVLDPFYLQFLTTDRGLNLSPAQFGLFVSLGSWVTMVFDYPTGSVADKLGRRATWAVALFSHAIGMLWLSRVRTFAQCLIVPIFQGISWALQSGSREAWLYDHAGEERTRHAVALTYLLSLPLTAAGISLATWMGARTDVRMPIALTGVILLGVGAGVMTFPENYGQRQKPWVATLKSGLAQFSSSRILKLLALENFFNTLPIWVSSAWWLTFLVEEWNVGVAATTFAFGITAMGTTTAGFALYRASTASSRSRYGENTKAGKSALSRYRSLLIYPSLVAGTAFCLMAVSPGPAVLVALVLVTIAARYFRSAGVTLLRNREITEDRATTLSLLGTLEGLVWAVTPLIWGIVIQAVGLRIVFLLAGVSSLISSVIFSIALSSRES